MNKEKGFTWKLGMFVIVALVLFTGAIYFIGKSKNLFGSNFLLKVQFKTVSGLKVGNNVRFSGINIGTVDEIELINDTSVLVNLLIKKDVQKFIKSDAKASISSDGLMGDKVLTITPGTSSNSPVKDNDLITSKSAIEMEDVMSQVKTSVDNAARITDQLAQFTYKLNNGNGMLSKLISDPAFSNSLKSTMSNLQTSSKQFADMTTKMNSGVLDSTMANVQSATKGLSENMEAVKHNIFLRGYFKKKAKADAKKLEAAKKAALPNKKDSIK